MDYASIVAYRNPWIDDGIISKRKENRGRKKLVSALLYLQSIGEEESAQFIVQHIETKFSKFEWATRARQSFKI